MVREFKLINDKGQEYSLMDVEGHCLLTEPSGLGYAYTTEYAQLGDAFITVLRQLQQGIISGVGLFKTYDNFYDFVNFVEKAESLKFAYKIPFKNGSKEFLKDVQIQSITKTQIQPTGLLAETITFDCLSLWYTEDVKIYTVGEDEDEIRWDFRWDSKFADYSVRNMEYVNEGHVEAPIYIVFDGPVANPKITLFVEGEKVQELVVPIELQKYEKLLYGTGTGRKGFYLNKQNTDGSIVNLFELDYITPKNDNVIRIPKNKSCQLQLTADGEVLSAEARIRAFYKIV